MTGLYQDEFVEALRLGVASLFAEWRLSAATQLSLISISENATFRADDPQRSEPVVIRVHRPGYHELAEIESELAWITGYRSVLPLSADDENALPMFIMLRRLLLTAWIASHSETPHARELGSAYTDGTVNLARSYLQASE